MAIQGHITLASKDLGRGFSTGSCSMLYISQVIMMQAVSRPYSMQMTPWCIWWMTPVQCRNVMMPRCNEAVQCTDRMVQCTYEMMQCADEMVQCTMAMVQCTNGMVQCAMAMMQHTRCSADAAMLMSWCLFHGAYTMMHPDNFWPL